jgi:formylglycine-generating enzyme required for sulfatase activity
MRSVLLLCAICGAIAARAADPTVSGVAVTQSDTGFVTVSYDLSGADAIITLELRSGDARLDTRSLSGDVNLLVSAGSGKKIYWRPRGKNAIAAGSVTARVTAWTRDVPPDYMSLPLMPSSVLRYYATTNDLPYPVVSDYYRTQAILFRRIPAKDVTFNMGSTADGKNADPNRQSNEDLHEVTFGADYYLSVFPVTQGQWRNGVGSSRVATVYSGVGSTSLQHRDEAEGRFCPVDNCSSYYIQGVYDGQTSDNLYKVDNNTWLQVMREYVGQSYIRLPTEAEWEYACRAGDDGAIYDASSSIDDLAWHAGNSGGETHPVGLKKPNAWGLYDMLGNVYEVCIDNYVANLGSAAVTEPYAKGGACKKTNRGGSYAETAAQCRCARRVMLCDSGWGGSSKRPECGFRLYCRIPQ